MFTRYIEFLKNFFLGMDFPEKTSIRTSEIISLITLVAISIIVFYFSYFMIKKIIYFFIKKSESKREELIIKNKVFKFLFLLIPTWIIRYSVSNAMPDFPELSNTIVFITRIFEILIYAITLDKIGTTIYEISKNKPLKGFLQIFKIIIYLICILLIMALITHQKISNIFIGLGTVSAILLLLFKDPILGFVGSIQLTTNDMIRIGDWIVMEKNKADGEVIEIGLTTVKVRNWDKTITTIPTYSLVSESFTNWRGMSDSGGRRIARSIIIDIETIKFCTEEMLNNYKKLQLVRNYIIHKEADIKEYNEKNNIETCSSLGNGRRQTNIGIFRAYLKAYLMSNPNINHNMTLMVRQLAPTELGIPIQIYAFSQNKEWLAYEDIQSDIFDHILAIVPLFDLKVYQKPSGKLVI